MPRLQFGLSSYKRARGDLPELPVINMFAEATPTEETGVVLQSRPGLRDMAANMGDGPVRALFRRDLVLGSQLYGVSGGQLYRGTTALGSINGTGAVSMAGYENLLFTNAGQDIWGWNGSVLTKVAFPDDALVSKVIVAGSRLVAIRRDTGRFYWSDVLGSTISGLAFATAENQPDRLLDMLFIDGVLRLFGSETIENWPLGQDADLPFTPLTASVIEKGIRATGCATHIGSTFAWVTDENQVCISDENNIVSNPGLQARIEDSISVSLFTFLIDGTEYLALRLDSETQIFNPVTGIWSEFASYSRVNWIPQCYADGVFGSSYDGRIMEWSKDHLDLGTVLERRFRAGLPINGGGVRIKNASLRCDTGRTPFLTGPYANPKVEMFISEDGGKTWGPGDEEYLGAQGDYRYIPQWRALGMADYPGFLCEFRVTDPVPFRVSDVLVNEPVGGR